MAFSINETGNRSGSVSDFNNRSYTRSFVVITDDKVNGAYEVFQNLGVILGAPHPVDAGSLCSGIDVQPDANSPFKFDVTVTYNSSGANSPAENGEKQTPDQISQPDPVLRPPRISFSAKQYEIPLKQTRNDFLICNSAGEPFDPPFMYQTANLILTISFYSAAPRDGLFADTFGCINEDTWFSYEPYKLKIIDFQSAATVESGLVVYDETWHFELAGLEQQYFWFPVKILDAGFNQVDPTDVIGEDGEVCAVDLSKLKPIMVNGFRTSIALPLDGQGKLLEKGQPFFFKEYDIYSSVAFNDFLPNI